MLNYGEDPKLSIVVPVYNTEQYFDRCIKSLLGQSYQNIEIIVVNDGSDGNIGEIITRYTDNRIKYIDNGTNKGLLRSRVIGSSYASGEYIAFADSDDYVSYDFYRTLVFKAHKERADIVIGSTVWTEGEEKYVYNLHQASLNFESLEGDEIKHAFFDQEMQCYSWHTIWNKVYRKSLWDLCCETYKTVESHIVMTEDIYFSTILFLNARHVSRVRNDAYFYCVNVNASTNAEKITIGKFRKNISDIKSVFDEIQAYAERRQEPDFVLTAIQAGRMHYARMWNNLANQAFDEQEKKEALEAAACLCSNVPTENIDDEYFFESIKTPWNGGLEYIKEQIGTGEQEWISFDLFDTLVKRPFYTPEDLLCLLDTAYHEMTGNSFAFSKIRKEAEKMARRKYGERAGVEDITLDEIYDYLSDFYGIETADALEMKTREQMNEISFCEPRAAGVELFELAVYSGKKVILISDMYLRRDTIETILSKCGIQNYHSLFISSEERCLKHDGRLYLRAISNLKTSPEKILHIGDNWISDVEGSRKAGIESIFFPKAIEVFENKIRGCTTNRCATLGKDTCGENINYNAVKTNLGFRCMLAMAANDYFDNPYRTFHKESDLNADPFFIGYYALGMHLTGVAKWIASCAELRKPTHLYFLSRDGFLPMLAFKRFAKDDSIKIDYIQASRKALLPTIIREKTSLYDLPVEYRAHSPYSLMKMLSFLAKDEGNDLYTGKDELNVNDRKPFDSVEEYQSFIRGFTDHLYDAEKHRKAQDIVSRYYRELSDKGLAFDMGYSGRIQSAICDAAEKNIDVMFLHEDYRCSSQIKADYGFSVTSFYDYHPSVTGLIREHLFSDCGGSCIGFREENNTVIPVLEENCRQYPDRFVVRMMQKASLKFVNDYLTLFENYQVLMNYSSLEVSIPFEGFLRRPSSTDLHIFSASYFEDTVYGGRDSINIEEFLVHQLTDLGWFHSTVDEEPDETCKLAADDEKILFMINKGAQWKRAVAWFLFDRHFFLEKLKVNIKRVFRNKDKVTEA